MLKLEYLSQVKIISTTLISFFSVFTTISVAQDSPNCYMVTPSGQVITLNSMCERQDSPKAKACEGPFDDDGFPLALSNELEELKKAIVDAKQRGVRTIDDPRAQSALMALLKQMPFPDRIHSLLQEQRPLAEKAIVTEDPVEEKKLMQKYAENSEVLVNNKCLGQLIKSLYMKFPEPLFYY